MYDVGKIITQPLLVACKTFITLRPTLALSVHEWSGRERERVCIRSGEGEAYENPCWGEKAIRRRNSKIEKLCKLNLDLQPHLNAQNFYANCKSREVIKVLVALRLDGLSSLNLATSSEWKESTCSYETSKRILVTLKWKAFPSHPLAPQWPSTIARRFLNGKKRRREETKITVERTERYFSFNWRGH